MTESLHYYPGHFHKPSDIIPGTTSSGGGGLLVYIKDGKVVHKSEAWGGYSKTIKDTRGGPDFTPTPSGHFVLETPAAYRTSSWLMSQIKWGTLIKDVPAERNLPEHQKTDVWYQLKDRKNWGSIYKDYKIDRKKISDTYFALYGLKGIPKTWIFNAFGPLAIRYFKDLNNNKKLDKKSETLEGSMFHTTAENESELKLGKTIDMTNSHGCIHLNPADRAQLTGLNAFRGGMDLVIYPYDKKFTP